MRVGRHGHVRHLLVEQDFRLVGLLRRRVVQAVLELGHVQVTRPLGDDQRRSDAATTLWPAPMRSLAGSADATDALATLLDTTRGLQRAAHAGPFPATDGDALLWLAVLRFEQGRFTGDYVAALSTTQMLAQLAPDWFLQHHRLSLAADGAWTPPPTPADTARFIAPINLPGAQWRLQVDLLDPQTPLAPRVFFGIAMACLAGMLLALVRLWRHTQRRQRAEARLQTQLALRTAMERSVTLGLRAWDTEGRLLYANPAFCRLVGWTPQELTHQTPASDRLPPYWPPEQGSEFRCMRDGAIEPELQQTGQALQLLHRDGQRIDVLAHSAPLVLADGTLAGWVGSVLDLTERRRVERLAARQQELLEASGRLVAVGEVASTLAHELNQPLGALSGFASGLLNRMRERNIGYDDIVPVVERIERMAEKAGHVIQRVNAFARRQDIKRQPLALAPFARRVALGVNLPDGVQLELHLPPGDGPVVPADALLLENALHNLVLNAGEWAHASASQGGRSPGRVLVEIVTAEGAGGSDIASPLVGLRVADSGPGVPAEQRTRIFDAFASGKPGGMGMGLAICRSVVEAHRGRIEVADSPTLLGAQFTLWLPLNT